MTRNSQSKRHVDSRDAQEGTQEAQGEAPIEKRTNLSGQPRNAIQGELWPLEGGLKKRVKARSRLEHPHARVIEKKEVSS